MVKMTRISPSVLFTPCSKLHILTERRANDVKFISSDRQELDLSKYIYSYGTVNSIFAEIQPDSTNIKNDPRMTTLYLYQPETPIHISPRVCLMESCLAEGNVRYLVLWSRVFTLYSQLI